MNKIVFKFFRFEKNAKTYLLTLNRDQNRTPVWKLNYHI